MTPFALVGEGVRLSVPTGADIPDVLAACQDPDIQRWVTAVPVPYLQEHAEGFVQQLVPAGWAAERELCWAIREGGDLRPGEPEPPLLGMCGITLDGAPHPARSGEIGWWLTSAARGRGLAEAVTRLLLDFAFDPEGLALARVQWTAVVGNWASRRVAWKAGFRVEGEVRGMIPRRGERVDGWIGTVLPGDRREPNEPWPDDAPPLVR